MITFLRRAVGVLLVGPVAWVLATAWGPVTHAHPAYPVLLGLTAVVGVLLLLWRGPHPERPRGALRATGLVLGLAGLAGWALAMAWLRPFTPQDAALAAMVSDDAVTVTETATQIVLRPTEIGDGPALFFQPGARVDARAYVATLRPIAEAGVPVVAAKQPLGIGFLALGGFSSARGSVEAEAWVVGGHSLGGTVAATTAASAGASDVVGLLLWAAYPASDASDLPVPVLSVSGSEDGLATPEDIEASRSMLPPDTTFVVVDGASHASFGAYGAQPGDGSPLLDAEAARAAIAQASIELLTGTGD